MTVLRKSKTNARPAKPAPPLDPRFERIAARLIAEGNVKQARIFGATGLAQNGKYFAMLHRGALIAKLPAERVAKLVGAGQGTPFDPGHGRVMKEWVSIPEARAALWGRIADEARAYVTRQR